MDETIIYLTLGLIFMVRKKTKEIKRENVEYQSPTIFMFTYPRWDLEGL